jgi:hypothetical protein
VLPEEHAADPLHAEKTATGDHKDLCEEFEEALDDDGSGTMR